MKPFKFTNEMSGVSHTVSFIEAGHSPEKIIILSDGRAIGKIHKTSVLVFCKNKQLYDIIKGLVINPVQK